MIIIECRLLYAETLLVICKLLQTLASYSFFSWLKYIITTFFLFLWMFLCILIRVLFCGRSWRLVLVYIVAAFWRVVTSLPVTDCIIQTLLLRHNLSTTHHWMFVYLYLWMWCANLPLKKKWCLLGVCMLVLVHILIGIVVVIIVMTILI